MLVDSHCHLDHLADGEELEAVVGRARQAGVGVLVTICTKLSEFERVRAIAERFDGVYCSVGVHPHEAAVEGLDRPERLIELAAADKVVGIGETGLDYHYEHGPRQDQQGSFHVHVQAARETGLPVIVHSREADEDTARILEQEYARGPFTGVLHCFTAGPALARAALDLGLYISLSGVVTFKNAEALRRIVLEIPSERLLVETDSPYLAPVPKRGRRNQPAYLVHTVAYLAELRGASADEIARITSGNFFDLFEKAAPSAPPADAS